jgi:histidine phosphotransferase ChpT
MDDEIRLAELMCARLCHDLAGPAGAVANGAELLDEDDPETVREAGQLMAGAAAQIAHRLRFMRAAFGWEGGAARSAEEAFQIASDFLAPLAGQPGRFSLAATGLQAAPQDAARLLLLLVLFASEALPRGGAIAVSATPGQISVEASGKGAALGEDLSRLADLPAPTPTATPKTAPILLALGLARRFGWRLSARADGDCIRFQATR